MANKTNKVNNAPEVANATENASQPQAAEAVAIVKNSIKDAVIKDVFINQFDGDNHKTISLMLNKELKLMRQNDAGLYDESTTTFLQLPMAKLLSEITDDVVSYFISVKGTELDVIKTALSGATINIDQRLFADGETIDDITNESGHDQWFSFIKSFKVSKMATITMCNHLGLSIDEIKLMLE